MRRRAFPIAAALALLLVPLGALFFVLIPLAGAAVVWLHQRYSGEPVSTRSGVRIGAFTGAVAFLLWVAILASSVAYQRLVLHQPDHVTEGLRQSLVQSAARNPDPAIQEFVGKILASPDALAGFLVLSGLVFFVLFVSLCSAGGALGASFLKRKAGL